MVPSSRSVLPSAIPHALLSAAACYSCFAAYEHAAFAKLGLTLAKLVNCDSPRAGSCAKARRAVSLALGTLLLLGVWARLDVGLLSGCPLSESLSRWSDSRRRVSERASSRVGATPPPQQRVVVLRLY